MKKLILLISLSWFFFPAFSQTKTTIIGHSTLPDSIEKVTLRYVVGRQAIIESANIQNGSFLISVNLEEPTVASLSIKLSNGSAKSTSVTIEQKELFLQPGKSLQINVQNSLINAVVAGDRSQTDFEKLNLLLQPFNERYNILMKEYNEKNRLEDKSGARELINEFGKLDSTKRHDVYLDFLKKNRKSPIGLYVLESYSGRDIDPQKALPFFNQLSKSLKNSKEGRLFYKRIQVARKTAVGAMAIEFTQNDTLGKSVSLSDFRGKYVLVDFWASWCGPCRAENPNVVKAFNEYKDKNFTVLGVSLDQPGRKQSWLDAIHKDKLWWTQVSDLKYWGNAVAKLYGIRAIPQNLLIDPSGKIIARNIRGRELNEKLVEIFN
ncbi:MAG: TlpA disulfide reductase family protein [Ginsengibacter sp.]